MRWGKENLQKGELEVHKIASSSNPQSEISSNYDMKQLMKANINN